MDYLGNLSRRERQIMEIIYRKGSASAAEVQEELPDRLSNSAVRTILRILESKGQLGHEEHEQKFVYHPAIPKCKAERQACRDILATFFGGSVEQAMATLLELQKERLTGEELDRLAELIEQARKEGR